MILSDRTIVSLLKVGELGIHPEPAPEQVQPVSVDLLLSTSYVIFDSGPTYKPRKVTSNWYTLQPGQFVLASTKETVKLPAHVMGQVHGKSTLARKGLQVEAAGLVDPGYVGAITLELKNLAPHPIPLLAGQPICQISFHLLDVACARPYGTEGLNSHYQGQTRATPAAE